MPKLNLRNIVLIVGPALIALVGLYVIKECWPPKNQSNILELSSAWQAETESRIRLVSAQTAVGDGVVLAGVDLQLTKGWKTYWRNSGDSGFAPQFDWSASDNIDDVEIIWPAPQVFGEAGERYYGYKDEVLWPLRVKISDATKPANLVLTLNYGVCADVCVPVRALVQMEVPAGNALPTDGAALIDAASAKTPGDAVARGFTPRVSLAKVEKNRAELNITIEGGDFEPAFVIATGAPGSYFAGSNPFGPNGFIVALDDADPERLRGTEINLVISSASGDAVEGSFLIQ
ncbi:MAG: protein-disulfide reductase DsbD family protein [Parvibaculum sp.]